MATEYGFIYFLSNPMMPNVYKIGFTLGHPKTRLAQLSSATACPIPFQLLACFGVMSPNQVEADIHEELDRYRVNSSREFFKCKAQVLQTILREYCDPFGDIVMDDMLNSICHNEEKDGEIKWRINYFFEQNVDSIFWPEPRHDGGFN